MAVLTKLEASKAIHIGQLSFIAPGKYASVPGAKMPVCYFDNHQWNLNALPGDRRPVDTIHFSGLADLGIKSELNVLLLKTIAFAEQTVNQDLPKNGTFYSRWIAWRGLAKYAEVYGKDVFTAIQDKTLFAGFARYQPAFAKVVYASMVRLQASRHFTNMRLAVQTQASCAARIRRQLSDNEKQTPPIPTRIYSAVLKGLEEQLSRCEAVVDDLIGYIEGCAGRWPNELQCPEELINFVGIGYDFDHPRANPAAGVVTTIYAVCELNIGAHSGMRAGEIQLLPYDCRDTLTHRGVVYQLIRGVTTKNNKGESTPGIWVTNRTGERAIILMRKLVAVIYRLNGFDATSTTARLFPRHGLFSEQFDASKRQLNIQAARLALYARVCPVICEDDVLELERYDQDRNWRDEPIFSVGRAWPLRNHQFRRSLGLYAHGSGLVQIPELKAQLKQITDDMAFFYASGSTAVHSLKFAKDHIAVEWRNNRHLSEFFAYQQEVLFGMKDTWGGAVAWAKSPGVQRSSVSVMARGEAMQMFKRGELAYKETITGGCTTTGECKLRPLNVISVECIRKNCKDLVVVQEKLALAIAAQKAVVTRLHEQQPETAEYRFEQEILSVLKTAYEEHATP